MGKIDTLHQKIYDLVATVTEFNQGFYERPKEITSEKLPAYAVFLENMANVMSTNATNKRTYLFVVEVIYDKENLDTTQTVISDLLSSTIDVLEDPANYSLSANAHYTLPTTIVRIEDYLIGGKHYLAYRIELPVIVNTVI